MKNIICDVLANIMMLAFYCIFVLVGLSISVMLLTLLKNALAVMVR